MGADELQKVFRTLSDPTRVRILALLAREELSVGELMDVLGMAQSRVSRHLAILREAGLLGDRRDGTYVFYRFAPPTEGPWRAAWSMVVDQLAGDSTAERDAAALIGVMDARAARTRSFFDAVGPEWDALRKVFHDDALRARALTRLIDPSLVVADVGTGTGILAIELARLGLRVVAVDHSARMLEAARTKIERESGLGSGPEGGLDVDLRHGEAGDLPLSDGEVDAAFAHMVLHYLPSPAEAIAEMARILKPGGVAIAVDFVPHTHDWMRQELGVTWLGFSRDEVGAWFDDVGLVNARYEEIEGSSSGRDLPATFIASGRKPR